MIEKPRLLIRDKNDVAIYSIDDHQYYASKLHQFLSGKATILEVTIIKNKESYELLTVGKAVSFIYEDNEYWLKIMNVSQNEYTLTFTAWSLGLEWSNEDNGPYKAAKAMTFSEYMAIIDVERTVVIGINEVSDKKILIEWTGTDKKLARLYSLATNFDAEVEFVTNLNDNGSLKTITLNVYRKHSDENQGIGKDRRNEVFRYGKDIKTVSKEEDINELFTAIIATGNEGLSIADIDYEEKDSNGNTLFVTKKTTSTLYPDPKKLYAPFYRDLYPSAMNKTNDRYILKTAGEFDYKTKESLFGYMLSQLKELVVPKVTWTIEGHVTARVGDTVSIENDGYKPTLLLEARVIEQEINLDNPATSTTTFSNVVEVSSKIDGSILKAMQQIANKYSGNRNKLGADEPENPKNGDLWYSTSAQSRIMSVTSREAVSDPQWKIYQDGTWIVTDANIPIAINSLSNMISILNDKVTTLETSLETLQQDFSVLSQSIVTLEETVGHQATDISDLTTRIEALENKEGEPIE